MKTLSQVRFIRQRYDWDCAVACLLMLASPFPITAPTHSELTTRLNTSTEVGTTCSDIERVARELFRPMADFRSGENGSWQLLAELRLQNYLVMICYQNPEEQCGHYALVDEVNTDHLMLIDPAYGPHHRLNQESFVWTTGFEIPRREGWYLAIRPHRTGNIEEAT